MKCRGIAMTLASVHATRQRRKSQTRRVIVPQPSTDPSVCSYHPDWWPPQEKAAHVAFKCDCGFLKCPYGVPGDLLAVREPMEVITTGASKIKVRYLADGAQSEWLHYPHRLTWWPTVGKLLPRGGYREAWRTILSIEGIRAERVQEITPEDICAEGIWNPAHSVDEECSQVYEAWADVWDSINAKRGHPYEANEWAWVVVYKWLDQFASVAEALQTKESSDAQN